MRFSLRTWYAAKSRDTLATLTIRGRTIFRVVRIGTPQSKYEDRPRGLGAGGRVDYDSSRPARESRISSFQQALIPEVGVMTTWTATFLPSAERYSTFV